MKKNILLVSSVLLTLSSCDFSSGEGSEGSMSDSNISSESSTTDTSTTPEVEDYNIYGEDYSGLVNLSTLNDETAKDHLPEDASYETNDFKYDNVKFLETYVNNQKVSNDTTITETDDVKYVFYNDNSARFVSLPEGYAISLPTETTLAGDFSLGKYRSKIYNEETTLTISKESSNPYSKWETYRDEWLVRFLEKENWLIKNNLTYTRARKFEDTKVKSGYSIIEYDIEIKEPGRISKMYYNIAVLRSTLSNKNFFLLVMKSNRNRNEDFDNIVKSFKRVDEFGVANNNTYHNMELKENPNWNEKTKKYFKKLCSMQSTDWGFYSGNLYNDGSESNVTAFEKKQKKYTDAFECNFGIVSSYAHVSWSGSFSSGKFPKDCADAICGDGEDGKPVLQFNYQFTDNNNDLGSSNVNNNSSPLLDILRGDNGNDLDFDSYQNDAAIALSKLATAIKEYKKPVLFRLNNEMNTDWTSYCGMINLLDPDLFQASWRILYKIFEEKGVDNCIWIFNPIAKSCPYSSWGEDMCYFPGNDYVQVLGLTYYVMNNENEATSQTFKSCYTELYNKNKDVWMNYPWIISEFGCGSGGAASGTLYRNQESQAQWVKDMFVELNKRDDYCKNIKGAVWFSVNDYASNGKISNALEIVIEKLPKTVKEFKDGFKLGK